METSPIFKPKTHHCPPTLTWYTRSTIALSTPNPKPSPSEVHETPPPTPPSSISLQENVLRRPLQHVSSEYLRYKIPRPTEDGEQSLLVGKLDNRVAKCILEIINVSGVQNGKETQEIGVPACKMVQREISLKFMMACHTCLNDDETEKNRRISGKLRINVVRICKQDSGLELLQWVRGDIPIVDKNGVRIGEPSLLKANKEKKRRGMSDNLHLRQVNMLDNCTL